MANGSWTAATNLDWSEAGNWTGGVPGNGDTATFDAAVALPTSNHPGAGSTINFIIGATFTGNGLYADFLGSGGATIGTVTVSSGGSCTIDANHGGITVSGTLYVQAATTAAGNITIATDGTINAAGAGAVIDGIVTCTGISYVDWGSGNLGIAGGFNANGQTVTHTNSSGATITLDTTATLSLGGANSLALVSGDVGARTVTAGAAIACKSISFTDADLTYVDGGFAHTIAGDIVFSAGTLTSTGTWSQTATGNLNTGTARTFAVLQPASGASVTSTCTGVVQTKKVIHGSGTLNFNAQSFTISTAADDFWINGSGTLSGAGGSGPQIYISAARQNQAITTQNQYLRIVSLSAADVTLTMTGDLNTGTGNLSITGINDNKLMTLDTNNKVLTAAAIALGFSGQNTWCGSVLFRGGIHRITSIAKAQAAATAPNAVNFGSCYLAMRNGGSIDGGAAGTAIAFTNTAAHIVAEGAVTINRIGIAAGEPLHCHNCTDGGTSGAAVDFNAHVAPGNPGLP